jgi:DNA-directed RNA polymerase subunit RPC12/RpoP
MNSLDKMIPPEESVPLRGQTFLDWENQADALRKSVLPTLLQERAALDGGAEAQAGQLGQCPRCGSQHLYLDRPDEKPQKEVISPHGPVVIVKQSCRCRDCGRSFSPSGA